MKKTVFFVFLLMLGFSSCQFFNQKPKKQHIKKNQAATKKDENNKKDSIAFSKQEAQNILASFLDLKGKNAQTIVSWKALLTVAKLIKKTKSQDIVTIDVFAEETYQAVLKLAKSKIPKPIDTPLIKSKITLLEVLSEKLARKTLKQKDKKQAVEEATQLAHVFEQFTNAIKFELEEHPNFSKDLEEIKKYSTQ